MRPSIVLFGDSMTQLAFGAVEDSGRNCSPYPSSGWASLLSARYSRRADVLNRGFRGYNTEMALSVVPDVFQPLTDMDILFVTVFFGANDALQKGSEERGYTNTKSDLRHVPLEKFGDNTSKIVQLIRQHCSKSKTEALPIILLTPPPVHREKFEEYSRAEFGELRSLRNNDAARAYGNKVKEVANELECHVVDVFSLLGGDGDERDYEQYLADGLHLTEKGNALVYEGLTALIEEELPHLAPKDGETGVPLEGKSWQELC